MAVSDGKGIDWSTAEALAFGSLLEEGYPVRLVGQDSGRGTFSQRHSVLRNQQDNSRYIPLNNISNNQKNFEVVDSFLSELAVLGFEYGYSLVQPNTLTMWEAQFGDFANGAQVVIDQFIASGERKWTRASGLVMLLPHGYEGQGPEHSSARLERYLQLCAAANMQVMNLTTPANLFHAFCRQLKRDFRKPLVIMSPKSLLRHPLAVSKTEEFTKGSFQELIDDTYVDSKKVKRVNICTGKIYYDLLAKQQEDNRKDVALVRLEQIYPMPETQMEALFKKYPKAQFCWVQEEPKNMGGWMFVRDSIEEVMEDIGMRLNRLEYAGRPAAASPATGSLARHNREQNALVADALGPMAAGSKKTGSTKK